MRKLFAFMMRLLLYAGFGGVVGGFCFFILQIHEDFSLLIGMIFFLLVALFSELRLFSLRFNHLNEQLRIYRQENDQIMRRFSQIQMQMQQLQDDLHDPFSSLHKMNSNIVTKNQNQNDDIRGKLSKIQTVHQKSDVAASRKSETIDSKTQKDDETINSEDDGVALTFLSPVEAINKYSLHIQAIIKVPEKTLPIFEILSGIDHSNSVVQQNSAIAAIQKSVSFARKVQNQDDRPLILTALPSKLLSDKTLSHQLISLLEANQALKGGIIFKIDYAEFGQYKTQENATLSAIRSLGFLLAFHFEEISTIEFETLLQDKAEYVMIPATQLAVSNSSSKGKTELKKRQIEKLTKNNIHIIACDVLEEQDVLNLLDLEISFAQGEYVSAREPIAQA